MDTFFQRALPYIEMGWQVYPCRPDKVPLCPHGRNDATTVSLTIEDWSDKFPDANIGIKTGKTSGICVIDVDSEEGERWIASVNKSWAKLPETAEAKSGRGRHLYFGYPSSLPVKSADGKLYSGVDLKASGGSITAPISLHASGKLYEWIVPPFGRHLPTLPLWIVKALQKPEPKQRRRSDYDGLPPSDTHIQNLLDRVMTAPMGERNHTLNKVAFILGLVVRDGHMTESQAQGLLHQAGVAAGLEQIELVPTIKSGLRSGIRTKRNR